MSTALITGASSGLGAEFARQLAARGHNLILTARRQEKLAALASELSSKYNLQASVLVADLTQEEDLQRVEQTIEDQQDLEILVNNAGFGIKDRFSTGQLDKHLNMIQVHIVAAVRLSRAALPGMIANRKGGIINVASMAAFTPARGATYGATKAYLLAFSQGLHMEVKSSGVQVQALCPGFTTTGFHSTAEYEGFRRSGIPRFLWLTSEFVVRQSLRDLDRRKVVSIPGWHYKIAFVLARSALISGLVMRIASRIGR